MEKERVKGIIESNIKVFLKENIRDINKMEKAIKENDDKLRVDIIINENDLEVKVYDHKKNVFGHLLKFDWYDLNFDYVGNYNSQTFIKK